MLPALRRRSGDIESPLDLIRRDFDWLGRDLSSIFDRWLPMGVDRPEFTAAYPVDIREENGKVNVDAELPGFTKDQIDVTLENGILHICAERKDAERKGKTHLNERRYSRVERKLSLPGEVDDAGTVAKFENGVLHLSFQKKAGTEEKKIKVA